MISPQHLLNTGICGLFCATLFSLAAAKPATEPVGLTRSVPIAQDYTLHIKSSKVERRNFTPVMVRGVQKRRTLTERDQEAREKRMQFEALFIRANTHVEAGQPAEDLSTIIVHPEDADVILKRARKAVYHGIDVGSRAGESQ